MNFISLVMHDPKQPVNSVKRIARQMLADHVTKRPVLDSQFQPGIVIRVFTDSLSNASGAPASAGSRAGRGREGRTSRGQTHTLPGQQDPLWARAVLGEAPQRVRETERPHSPQPLGLNPSPQGHVLAGGAWGECVMES